MSKTQEALKKYEKQQRTKVKLEDNQHLSVAQVAAKNQSKLRTSNFVDKANGRSRMQDFFRLSKTQVTVITIVFAFFCIVAVITAVVVYFVNKMLDMQRRQDEKLLELQKKAFDELVKMSPKDEPD